jgi:hypothetical protein
LCGAHVASCAKPGNGSTASVRINGRFGRIAPGIHSTSFNTVSESINKRSNGRNFQITEAAPSGTPAYVCMKQARTLPA